MHTLPPTLDTSLRDVEALLHHALRSDEPDLERAAREVVGAGGKRLRPRVMVLAYQACGALEPTTELIEAAAGVELIHTASLVHDDVIDRADKRRGRPTARAAQGDAAAIVAGDFLFTKGFQLAGRQDHEVVRLTAQACTRLAEGELLELRCTRRADLDLETYLRIVACKTAALLEGCGRIGAHLAGRDDLQEALGAYGHHLGIAFQVSDDLLDVRGDPAVTGKPRGTDLRSGAPNAAVMFGLRNGARARLEHILAGGRQGEAAEREVERALQELLGSGAMAEAQGLAEAHARSAVEALDALSPSPPRRALIAIAEGVAARVA